MPKANITEFDQNRHHVQRNEDVILWDTEVRQLGLRSRNGKSSWIVQTRVAGRSRRKTLGDASSLKLDRARFLAKASIAALQDEYRAIAQDISIAQFLETFLEDCQGQWKPTTLHAHSCSARKHILPHFGGKMVRDLGRGDVVAWHNQLSGSAGTRNRTLAVLSSLMRHAELLGLRPPGSNPCAGLRRHQSRFSAHYLDAEAYAALGRALSKVEASFPMQVAFIRFLTFTGARKGEAETAMWHFLEDNRLTLPDSKTGPKVIWLAKPARRLLSELPRTGAYIFTDPGNTRFDRDLNKVWQKVRMRLQLPRLRLHDLRHSYASVAINNGVDLRVVGGLLGHSDPDTTAGYAHLNAQSVKQASNRVGTHLEAKLAPSGARLRPTTRREVAREHEQCWRFINSRQTLSDFCAAENLDPVRFRKRLARWRKRSRGGSAR